MSRARSLLPALVVVFLASPLAAEVAVRIVEPSPGIPVHGRVTIAAEVTSGEPIEQVLFFVDGALAAEALVPPWERTVDVGEENADHEFRVVAYVASGDRASSTVSTAAIAVDDAIDIELRQLYVTALRSGGRVLELTAGDFQVFDDDVPQKLVTFARGEVPITAVLLLDVSESMVGERLSAALGGAQAFIDGMRDLDEAKVVLFSDRVRRAVPFTGDKARLSSALDNVVADGGTAVNDFLYMGLDLLDERHGRRVVVLFSDGADVHSALSMRTVVEKARTSTALIYWIHLQESGGDEPPSFTSSWRDQQANAAEFDLLAKAVERSGGRAEILTSANRIGPAFAEIMAELREQYVLGYYPSTSRHDGSWHEVDVRARGTGVKLRHRGGYYDR